MKKFGLLIVLALILNLDINANGGPVDGSAVYRTGDIILMNYANINLEKEILKIKLEGDYSIISVTYQLKNNGYSKKDVTYGFPIDIIDNHMDNNYMEWQDGYVPYIQFAVNETELPIKRQLDYSIMEDKSDDPDVETIEYRRNWYVVDFSIDKDETINLTVNYKVKNGYLDWSTSKSFFTSYSERELIYDFSPAQYWGDGTIDAFSIEVDASEVTKHGDKINLQGIELKMKSGRYINKFRNYDLKTSENLHISYTNETIKTSEFITEHRIPLSNVKNITVSSQLLGNYSKDNLFDNNFETAWVEGASGNGVGETITIEFKEYDLAAIALINGYTKNVDTYTENNRIKKISIIVENVDHKDSNKIIIDTIVTEFEDLPYININLNNFAISTHSINDYRIHFTETKKITITILEVYPGKKYDDTCISELFLLRYQKKD